MYSYSRIPRKIFVKSKIFVGLVIQIDRETHCPHAAPFRRSTHSETRNFPLQANTAPVIRSTMLESERALILTIHFSVPRLNPCLRVITFSLSLSRCYTKKVRPFASLTHTFLPVCKRRGENEREKEIENEREREREIFLTLRADARAKSHESNEMTSGVTTRYR